MKSNCIFVSVASYRDAICSDTITSLFAQVNPCLLPTKVSLYS